MSATFAQRYVGTSVERSEDQRILTGTGSYIDDVQLPRMLHAAFVRSPMAHARINSVETAEAKALAGVHAVFTGPELQALLNPEVSGPGLFGPSPYKYTILATDKVRLVGDLVAIVVADTRYIAEDAVGLVDVDYDALPPIPDMATALDPTSEPIFADVGANVGPGKRVGVHGDVDAVFAGADRLITAKIEQHRHANVPMECRGCVSDFDPVTGRLTHHGANQGVQMVRNVLASQLDLSLENVRVVCKDIGGSFGLKIGASREEIAVAALSRHLRRPVKWIEDRNEHLSASGHAREETLEVEAAVMNDGHVLGLKVKMTIDTGAYPALGMMVGGTVERMFPGPYKMQALRFEYVPVITNKANYVAYRGPWASETFTRERVFDMIAKELGIDRLELRRRNLDFQQQNPGKMITGAPLISCTVRESIDKLTEVLDIAAFRSLQAARRADGRYLGLGVASYIESAPGPKGANPAIGVEKVRARLDDDGYVSIFTGQMPHGQGHETTFAQVAAEEFGVDFDRVRIIVGDSDIVPAGTTGGSKAATMAGGASMVSARALRDKVLDVAGHVLEASPADLEIADNAVRVRGVPTSAVSLAQIAVAARSGTVALPEGVDGSLEVEIGYDGGAGGWAGGTHAALVEVDIETGHVHIDRYIVIEDCGKLINPAIVDGQIRGGVAQGIGAVLLEKAAYDSEGNFMAGTFMDYLLPSMPEIPRIEITHLETVALDPEVNFRGVGEGGMIVCPPTLVGAIEDALAPFNVTISEQHLPPLRILELIGALD